MNRKQIISWTSVLLWMGVIFIFSAQTATDSSTLSSGITDWVFQLIINIIPTFSSDVLHLLIRKLAHFSIYFVLGLLVFNALKSSTTKQKYNILFALLISFLYAITDEIHQLFVPGRAGQALDVIIDSFGAITGIMAFIIIERYINKHKNKVKIQ